MSLLETGLATYPDVTIVCGRRGRDPEDPNAVTNPALIVEILSKSTDDCDREDRFEHYERIPSLRARAYGPSSFRCAVPVHVHSAL